MPVGTDLAMYSEVFSYYRKITHAQTFRHESALREIY